MIDNELARNGSGYYDETAYKAYMNMAKPGEIWTGANGGEYLIIQKQTGFYNVLRLVDNDHPENIRVDGKYTNPAMIHYLSRERLGVYVRSIPVNELKEVIRQMQNRLTFVEVQEVAKVAEVKREQKTRKQLAHELLDLILEGVK